MSSVRVTEALSVPLSKLRILPQALRSVDVTSLDYQKLRDNIQSLGLLHGISVTRGVDKDTGEEVFNIVDGAHRYTAAKELGITEVPITVFTGDDVERLIAQMSGNLQVVATKPVEYTKQLLKILATKHNWGQSDLAAHINQTTGWIQERLNLLKLTEPIQKMVDSGELNLSKAFLLAGLPADVQGEMLDDAKTLGSAEFQAKVSAKRAQLRKDAATGKTSTNEFVHKPFLRKMSDIKAEVDDGNACRNLCTQIAAAASSVTEAAEQGWAMALAWVTNSDPQTIEKLKAEHDQRIASSAAKREEAAKQRKARNATSNEKRLALELDLFRQGKSKEEIQTELSKFDAAQQPF